MVSRFIAVLVFICCCVSSANAVGTVELSALNESNWPGFFQEGYSHSTPSAQCDHQAFAEFIRSKRSLTPAQISRRLQVKLRACEPEVLYSTPNVELQSYVSLKYPIHLSQQVHRVVIQLPNGRIVKGSMGFQKSRDPRPLMVVRCGLFCEANNLFTTNALIMRFLEEGPFHVVVLESMTATDYIVDNHRLSLGGLYGGREVLEVIQALKDSDYGSLFSSFHVHGISLGGNSALMAAVYASQNPDRFPKISSVSAICPVIDLEGSISGIYHRSLVNQISTRMTNSQLHEVYESVDYLNQNYSPSDFDDLDSDEYMQLISDAAVDDAKNLTEGGWDLAPFKGEEISTRYDFYRASRMQDLQKYIKIPTYLFHATNDKVVLHVDNFKKMQESLEARPNPYMSLLQLERGDHCAFGMAYGWNTFSTIQRELLLREAPEMETVVQEFEVDRISEGDWFGGSYDLGEGESFARYSFHHSPGDLFVELHLKIFTTGDSDWSPRRYLWKCHEKTPSMAPSACYRTKEVRLSLQKLGLDAAAFDNKQSSNQLERVLNVRAFLGNRQKATIIGTSDYPEVLSIEFETLKEEFQARFEH